MKKEIFDQYENLVCFLGKTLGTNYEIVFHLIEEDHSYIAAIANNSISGRTKNSPLTGFALELMKKKEYLKSDYVTNYKAKSNGANHIQGSTFFIKDDQGNLDGMLCINTDYTKYKDIANDILQLINIKNDDTDNQNNTVRPTQLSSSAAQETGDEFVEVLSSNIKDIIFEVIGPGVFNENFLLNQDAKIHIVEQLEKKGIFQLKGAVSQVAEVLNVSEPSVYRYLKIVTKTNQV